MENYIQYPEFINFDGRPNESYTNSQLKKISLISDSYFNYVKLGKPDFSLIQDAVTNAHLLGKPFRLWAHLDFINSDKIV
jgi:alkaline phosphatase